MSTGIDEAFRETTSSDFNFSDELPNRWPLLLDEIKRSGKSHLVSRLRWGAHESLKNVRDFSASSKLRLERYLRLAHERGFTVELRLGFPSAPDAFPSWTQTRNFSNLVFHSALDPAEESLELIEIPALEDDEVRNGFIDFVTEVMAISALYRVPEGPVSKIIVDLQLYLGSLNAMQSETYAPTLKRRYETIENFNAIFGTSFRTFEAASSPQSIRLLAERRPWLVAFDYKAFQREYFVAMEENLRQREPAKQLGNLIQFSLLDASKPSNQSWMVAYDSTLLAETNSRVFPFFPGGFVNRSAITAYRFYGYLEALAKESKVSVLRFGGFERFPALPSTPIVVICGKYMQREDYNAMDVHLGSGGTIVFPMGFPQYDERMNSYEWPVPAAAGGKATVPLTIRSRHSGRVIVPSKVFSYGESFWSDLGSLMKQVSA